MYLIIIGVSIVLYCWPRVYVSLEGIIIIIFFLLKQQFCVDILQVEYPLEMRMCLFGQIWHTLAACAYFTYKIVFPI